MNFKIETEYNIKTLTVMAKALRKTVRKKRNLRSRIIGIIVLILALLLILPLGGKVFTFDFRTIITIIAALVLLLTLIFEDKLNGYVAKKRMLPGLDKSIVTFYEDNYFSETPLGKSEFNYENVKYFAENSDYFVFIFSESHAQIYSKNGLTGGSTAEFRSYIKNITGKEFINF